VKQQNERQAGAMIGQTEQRAKADSGDRRRAPQGKKQDTAKRVSRFTTLRTGDLVFVAGKVRQVLNEYHLMGGIVDLAYLGGDLLPGGALREFGDSTPYTVRAERISLHALEQAGAVEVDVQGIVELQPRG
jgi:hypothetical protein